jgi:hypothetical protein
MPSARASRTASGLLCAAALAAAGCGGDARAEADREDCVRSARAAAAYGVVAQAYRAGELGTPAEIERAIERDQGASTPGYEARSFLSEDGSLLPLARFDDDQRITFFTWVSSGEVWPELRDEITRAEERAADRAREDC